ncbi:hypothetical protein ACIHEJ_06600 [Streptomyces sp. NPDC052301]|uniref:hypothetical protein n=1 Tax=Streptomyces sp. NPDC052301 TaxID=3365687 RepID=UPI0037D91995
MKSVTAKDLAKDLLRTAVGTLVPDPSATRWCRSSNAARPPGRPWRRWSWSSSG